MIGAIQERAAVIYGALLALVLAVLYGPLVWRDPVLARDDRHILDTLHLRSVHSVSDWLVQQPLRDLTLHWDLLIQHAFGLGTFHLTNFFILALILAVTWKILRAHASGSRGLHALLLFAFALHPVIVQSVSWISARKHLLAFLMILCATKCFLALGKHRARIFGAGFFYLLSLLCHPIFVLWPAWALAVSFTWDRQKRRDGIGVALLCAPVLVAGAIANWFYYSTSYPQYTLVSKFAPGMKGVSMLGMSLLALGRYLMNLLLPVRIATVYDPGALLNLIGACLLPIFLWLVFRRLGWRRALPWVLFFFLPLLPVTVRMTNIFVSDTYALGAAFAVLMLASELLAKLPRKSARANRALAAALVLVALFCASLPVSRSWASDRALWIHAYETEPSPRSMAMYLRLLLSEGRINEAIPIAERLERRDPHSPETIYLDSRITYLDPALGVDEKLASISALDPRDPWRNYFLASLYARRGEFARAWNQVKLALRQPFRFSTEYSTVVAEGIYFCKMAGASGCQGLRPRLESSCEQWPANRQCRWDQRQFTERLVSLGVCRADECPY